MIKTDKTAILMASYQGERYLREQLDSILAQTYTEWELFVHDDGSTDHTCSILDEYEAEYPDRIHVIRTDPCGGALKNYFYLMKSVEAPYVMFCDQDDVWLREKIENTVDKMKEMEGQFGSETPLLVHSDLTVVDKSLNVISESFFRYQHLRSERNNFSELLVQNIITGCTAMINRSLCELVSVDINVENLIMHDWWCALVAAYFGKIGKVDGSILYRQHGGNAMGARKMDGLSNLHRFFSEKEEMKASIEATRRQSGEFARAYGLGKASLAYRYSRIYERSKLNRLAFYLKNNIRKTTVARAVGFAIFG